MFVLVMFFFIIFYGIFGLSTTSYTFDREVSIEEEKVYIEFFAKYNFSSLAGSLTLGYLIHNICMPIVKNAKRPENNIRDVVIGYVLVFFSYTLVGVLGYFGFKSIQFQDKSLEVT